MDNTDEAYNFFEELFLDKMSIVARHHYGKDSIVIWFDNRPPMIFTYRGKDDWVLKPYNFSI